MPMKLDTHLILPNFFLSNDSRTLTLTLSGKSIQGKSLEEKGEIDASKAFTKDNQAENLTLKTMKIKYLVTAFDAEKSDNVTESKLNEVMRAFVYNKLTEAMTMF